MYYPYDEKEKLRQENIRLRKRLSDLEVKMWDLRIGFVLINIVLSMLVSGAVCMYLIG